MSRFQKNNGLVAVFVLFEGRLYRAKQGSGQQLGVLYLGSKNEGPPANANAVELALREEVMAEPDQGEFVVVGTSVPPEPPWSLTIHHEEEDGDEHLWIARDFSDPLLPLSLGNQAWLLFGDVDVDRIDTLGKLEDADPTKPTRVHLYASGDAAGLGSAAHDYGAARDLDG